MHTTKNLDCELCGDQTFKTYPYPTTLSVRYKKVWRKFLHSNATYSAKKLLISDFGLPPLKKVQRKLNALPRNKETLSSLITSLNHLKRAQRIFSDRTICICEKCGLGGVLPKLTPDDLANYYESEYWVSEGVQLEDCVNARTRSTYPMLAEHIDFAKLKTVVEFGSGSGQLSRYLKLKNPHLEISCIEKGQVWHTLLRDTMAHIYSDIRLVDRKFDLFVSSHSIEHVPDLPKYFSRILEIINPGGYIYFEVPNSIEDEVIFNPKKPDYHVPHTYFFTPETFKKIESKYPLKLLSVKTFSRSYSQRFANTALNIQSEDENPNGAFLRALFQVNV